VVRQRILIPRYGGSNPPAPAIVCSCPFGQAAPEDDHELEVHPVNAIGSDKEFGVLGAGETAVEMLCVINPEQLDRRGGALAIVPAST
jgi:hypothetical protein